MAKSHFSKVKISGLSVVVPDYMYSADDALDEFFEGNPAKLARAKKQVGLGTRFVAPEGCTTTDVCEAAARELIEGMDLDLAEIDALVFVVQYPDHINPGSGCVMHRRLNLPQTCAVVDINHGCPGYVYGLWLASSMVESGACRKVLLLAGDLYPHQFPAMKSPKKSHSASKLMFGDGGSATLVEYAPEGSESHFVMGADGQGLEALVVPAGGARLPIDHDVLDLFFNDRQGQPYNLTLNYMNAMDVYNFSVTIPPANIAELLAYSGARLEDVDFVAIHQANKQIVDSVAAKAGLKPEQYSTSTFSTYGNQSTTSVPSGIAHVLAEKVSSGGQNVMLCGFGVGLAWGSALIKLDRIYCPGVVRKKFENIRTREEEIAYWIKQLGEAKK